MEKNKELIKNTFVIFLGKFCTQFISFLLVPIYTHYIGTNDYGYIDLVQSYMTLLVPILILRFDSGVFRFLIDERKNEDGKKNIISSTLFFLITQIVIFTIIFLIINKFTNIRLGISILLATISMAISSILLQISRGIGDNVGYSISSIIAGIITISLNVIFSVIIKKDISYILHATTIANLICSLFLICRNKIYHFFSKNNINKTKFKEVLVYSLPMIPDGLSWWIINVSDRSIISLIMGTSFNGIYAVSSKFSNILSSFFQIFNMSWQESASLHIKDKDKEIFFNNVLNEMYKIFYSLCLIIMVFIPIVFKFMIGEEYKIAMKYIPYLLYGNLFSAIANLIGGVYIAEKNTKSVARTTMMTAVINLVINLIFINKIGLLASAISTLISYIALVIYRYFDVRRYIKMKLNKKIVIITTIYFIFSSILYYNEKIVLNIFLACIFCFLLNKQEIINTLKKILRKERKI